MILVRTILSLAVAASFAGCKTGGNNSDASSMPPGAVGLPMNPYVVSMDGKDVADAYDKLNLNETKIRNGHQKSTVGNFTITCSRTGQGGELPPGAMGMAAPLKYQCSIYPVTTGQMPPGAQGMPARALLEIDGDAAAAFYVGFNTTEKSIDGGVQKTVKGTFNIMATSAVNDTTSENMYTFTITKAVSAK